MNEHEFQSKRIPECEYLLANPCRGIGVQPCHGPPERKVGVNPNNGEVGLCRTKDHLRRYSRECVKHHAKYGVTCAIDNVRICQKET